MKKYTITGFMSSRSSDLKYAASLQNGAAMPNLKWEAHAPELPFAATSLGTMKRKAFERYSQEKKTMLVTLCATHVEYSKTELRCFGQKYYKL